MHIDYCGPIDGKYFLVIIDAHSKFIHVHATTTTSSKVTIECLRKTFANFGIPHEIVSDNAQYFVSGEIKDFYKQNNIQLKNSAPFHPASNGLAERAVQTFKKGLLKFKNGSVSTRISRFLYNYRRTECSITKKSPESVLFNRKFRSPLNITMKPKSREKEVGNTEISRFVVGQSVFARNFGRGDKWLPGIIENVHGERNYVVKVFGSHGDMIWRRHTDQLKGRYNEIDESGSNDMVYKELSENIELSSSIPVSVPSSERCPELLGSKLPCLEAAPTSQQPEVVVDSTLPEVVATSPRREATPMREKSLPPTKVPSVQVTTRSGRAIKPPARYSN